MHHKPFAAHPNIVGLLGYGFEQTEARPSPFIVVELGSLGSLRAALQLQKPWDVRKKLIVAGDVAAGLMALHQAGVTHGDLKLDNVVCFRTQSRPDFCQAKLCDFSHSISTSGATKDVQYYGTPRYAPPEALTQRERPISSADVHKCDIWAFGLALWEILIDGDVYFQQSWLHDPQYSRPVSTSRAQNSSWSLLSSEPQAIDTLNSDAGDEGTNTFGSFDISHLSTPACKTVDRLTNGTASPLGFARSYLRPLIRRTLDSNPKNRFSDIARWPIVIKWQQTSPTSALESKLAFHTHTSNLTFDIFRPDRQADIAWSVQVHIHDGLRSVLASIQQSSHSFRTSLQLAFCEILGFGCDVDFSRAAALLEDGFQHSPVLAEFIGQTLLEEFRGATTMQARPFSDRMAVAFASLWEFDHHSTVSLYGRPTLDTLLDGEPHTLESWKLGPVSDLSQLLTQATQCSGTSVEAILSQSLIRHEHEKISLPWLELAILWNDTTFLDTHKDILFTENLDRINSWTFSPLMLACVRGQVQTVRRLLHLQADAALTTPDGFNLLHLLFCLRGQAVSVLLEAVRLSPVLIDKIDLPSKKSIAVDSQWPTEIEGSPLAIAVTVEHLPLARALLDLGAFSWLPAFASKEQDHDYLWTPMHLAIKYNFYNIVALFMEQPGPDSFVCRHGGGFPLASALSFFTIVERYGTHGLLSQEALAKTIGLIQRDDFDSSSLKGATAILQTVDFENYDVIHAILDRHPDLAAQRIYNPKDPSDFALPLHFACQIGARKDVQYALRIPKEIVDVYPATLMMKDSLGRSALHFAVVSESPLIPRWLLDSGLDVNSQDFEGRTPLMLCLSARTSVLLIERGANVNLRDKQGKTAAHYVVIGGKHEILEVLLKHGVRLDSTTTSLSTLLHDAVSALSLECVKLLCQAGASVNALAQDGCTPLHLAMTCTPDIVRELVDRGSNLTIKDASGRTAVQIAMMQLTSRPDGLSEARAIFRSLIQPLCNTSVAEKYNKITLPQILHMCAAHGSGTSIQVFFQSLDRETSMKANTPWKGIPPIHAAASTLNLDSAVALTKLENLDVNAFDHYDRTVLMCLSTLSCKGQIVRKFFELVHGQGARLNLKNRSQETAWSIALRNNHFTMLRYLLTEAPSNALMEMLSAHPKTASTLLSAIDTDHDFLVSVFSRRVQIMPPTYDPDLLNTLAETLACTPDWTAVGRRLYYMSMRTSPHTIRDIILGIRISWKWKSMLDDFDNEASVRWLEDNDSDDDLVLMDLPGLFALPSAITTNQSSDDDFLDTSMK